MVQENSHRLRQDRRQTLLYKLEVLRPMQPTQRLSEAVWLVIGNWIDYEDEQKLERISDQELLGILGSCRKIDWDAPCCWVVLQNLDVVSFRARHNAILFHHEAS